MTEYVKQESKLEWNFQKAYALIFRQCTEHMRSKLESHDDYKRMREDYSAFLLMGAIKGLNFKFNWHKHPPHALHDAKRDFY